jgi:hypothetical protein
MKHIIEYKLWNGEVPFFVEDGGYFLNYLETSKAYPEVENLAE